MEKVITAEINNIKFSPINNVKYKHNYVSIYESIARNGKYNGHSENSVYRRLVKTDLFFIIYFVFNIKDANHPFIVKACSDVENGPITETLDLWGREHYKSTIITKGETIQKILNNSEERIAIFSHTRPAAKAFLRSIKMSFEGSLFLQDLFPDILYHKPSIEAPKWSEDDGLILKRSGFYNEATLEAWGLVEGMPTGKHFSHRVYDDITTMDLIRSPEQMLKVKESFDMSDNLGTKDGTLRIVGTPYHYEDTLAYIRNKKDENGKPIYHTRLKPTLEGGQWDGKPVLLSAKRIKRLKSSPEMFKTQHLLNPTPDGTAKLNSDYLEYIDEKMIPSNIQKFMIVDPAGSKGKGDAYAIMVFGVEPEVDEIGASRIFLLDASLEPLEHSQAIETVVRMYINAGVIQKLGVEKVGQSTAEIHIVSALKARGRHISVRNKNLIILQPSGRNKINRIESALVWPLNNGKLFISSSISDNANSRIIKEMEKFPYWHDDALDCWSYLYDILKDCIFSGSYNRAKVIQAFSNRCKIQDNIVGY